MKKNFFLTVCCALVPGCGQMYQGYMKRGLSLMVWFFLPIAVAYTLYLEGILLILPVVWAYSFFDTFNLRNLSEEQRAALGDFFLPSGLWSGELKTLTQNIKLAKLAGWVCIIAGVFTLYGTFWNALYSFIWSFSPAIAAWMDRLPALLIALAVILLGVWLLRRRPAAPAQDEPQFTGGDEHA